MTNHGTTGTGAVGGPVRHVPVLLPETIDALSPRDNGTYIDGTFGAGGITRALLESADCIVLAIDKDPDAITDGQEIAVTAGDRLKLVHGAFGNLGELARDNGFDLVDGVTFDLGVSSMQLDQAERGFSFQADGPLDMRMSQTGPSAADIVNSLDERDLAQVIYVLGDERRSRAIARAIVAAREKQAIERTSELADIVAGVLGRRHDDKKHPATRTFQALRLYVNGELDELVSGLFAAEQTLREGGRLAVVTFHSIEDRIVKRFLASRSGKTARPSRHAPVGGQNEREPSFRLLHRRAIGPGNDEVRRNPRARSARLRAGERTNAPAFPPEMEELGVPKLSVNIR